MRCEFDGTIQPGNHRAFFVRAVATNDFFAFPVLYCNAIWTRLLLLGIIYYLALSIALSLIHPAYHMARVLYEPCRTL